MTRTSKQTLAALAVVLLTLVLLTTTLVVPALAVTVGVAVAVAVSALAVATITTIRTTIRYIFFTTEANATITTVTGFNPDQDFIDKFHDFSLFYPKKNPA